MIFPFPLKPLSGPSKLQAQIIYIVFKMNRLFKFVSQGYVRKNFTDNVIYYNENFFHA